MKTVNSKRDVLPSWKVILLLQILWLIPCGCAYYRDYIAPAKAEQAVEMVLEETEYEKALLTPPKAISSAKNK